jgi:uncharacterized protein
VRVDLPEARRPVMHQRWLHLLFLHWPLPPAAVQGLLPAGLEVDTFEGRAWIGLVPFTIRGVRPPLLPAPPLLSDFHEVNLRTYVRCAGQPGVWFFSLDAASRLAVLGARAWYRLPYHHARMRMDQSPDADGSLAAVDYESERRWPGPLPARCAVRYAPRGPVRTAAPGSLEHFLIERYVLYAASRGRLRRARVAHEPYPIQDASFDSLRESLSAAAGLAGPAAETLAHYSRGVSVEVFAPIRL